uniref:uncharacterized protein LOC101299385 isoform X2 n=1 Tax=Fragaria vesca subsp. vesca TaxID=101020 RepID=UPI0005CA4A09|nr:PREDICTED: uncharacterized protein LOC101299385 isoform X2 [Fragaria vesca subsp. vesca]
MGTKQRDLHKSFNLAIRSLLSPCSFQDFWEALPNFTTAEHERLHRLFTQVLSSLHANIEEEFQSICLETQVGTAMDTVERMVEEQSLDPLYSNKTNVMDAAHNLSGTTKTEIQYLTKMLEKAEAENHLKRDRIELIKKGRPDMSNMANAVEKFADEKWDFKLWNVSQQWGP